jgi:hypothetical protein
VPSVDPQVLRGAMGTLRAGNVKAIMVEYGNKWFQPPMSRDNDHATLQKYVQILDELGFVRG